MFALEEASHFAVNLADRAGELALRHFRQPLAVERKEDESPVTIADRSIESMIREAIVKAYPDHGILGEEEGEEHLERQYVWVVDPIDGTKSFVTGNPLFGGLIGLLKDGVPCFGQIDMPALGERWSAIAGGPARLNGQVCRTRNCVSLEQAYAYTTDPALFVGGEAAIYAKVQAGVRQMRYGGDCYNYALLAGGYCDLVIETGQHPYDYLPVVQIVQSAGGVITDWSGAPLHTGSGGAILASATPELHEQALARIAAG